MEHASDDSTSPRNGASDSAPGNPEEELLAIGHKRLFSDHSFFFSADELRSLDIEDKKLDESSSTQEDSEDVLGSETPSSKASTSDSDHQSKQKYVPQWREFIRVLKKGSTAASFLTLNHTMPAIKKFSKKKSRNARQNMAALDDRSLDPDLYCFKSSWKNFSLSELGSITNNFSPENLIAEGGYSEVYKGELEDGQLVAIKRLTRGTPEEMTADFLSELGILVHVNHRNIANVIGYGVEGGMHLVLHLSPHGSLASLLTAAKEKLTWPVRYKIALGAAEGLTYLHEGCQRRIIHRDIKAANILLSENFEPQISDFGLAKWLPEQWPHLTVSQFEGTFGYLPPEFFTNGTVDEKTDVYAFGVLLLELITGRLALDKLQKSLVMWAKPFLTKNDTSGLVDPMLAGAYDSEQLNHMVLTASLCLHEDAQERPQMAKVVQMLTSDDQSGLEKARKFQRRRALRRIFSKGLSDTEDCNSSKYVNDNQIVQIALGL